MTQTAKQAKHRLLEEGDAIVKKAEREDRDLTPREEVGFRRILNELDRLRHRAEFPTEARPRNLLEAAYRGSRARDNALAARCVDLGERLRARLN